MYAKQEKTAHANENVKFLLACEIRRKRILLSVLYNLINLFY